MWTFLWIVFSAVAALAAPPKPRLVLVIAVDQLRSDYLTRFEHQFLPAVQKGGKPGGFRYFMDRGAYFTSAQTGHAVNVTGVGHATMLTGAFPYLHGIVANQWYGQVGDKVYCASDPKDGRSPMNLLVTTVGDEMKNAWGGRSLVAGVAQKDRGAILMAGRRADLAVWYGEFLASSYNSAGSRSPTNADKSGWVTSSYYKHEGKAPPWLERWNAYDYFGRNVPKIWKKLLPDAAYALSSTAADAAYSGARGLGKRFPHPINDAAAGMLSPWGNAYALDTALELVKGMKFGADDVPDLLNVSLSSFDALGHNFGPMSPEMQDATLRLDRALAEFFAKLDKLVPGGLARTIIVLTADHGAHPNPALAEQFRLPGGAYWNEDLLNQANAEARRRFGFSQSAKPVAAIREDQVFLNLPMVRESGKDVTAVARGLAEWLRGNPMIAAAYAKTDVLEGRMAPNAIATKLGRSVHPERSGDVVFVPRPGWMELDEGLKEGTGHETATVQDAAIPLAFVGPPFRKTRFANDVLLNDLAPTLSAVLGIIPPSGNEGRVLTEALTTL